MEELYKESFNENGMSAVFVKKSDRKVIVKRNISEEEFYNYDMLSSNEVWNTVSDLVSFEAVETCVYLPESFREDGKSDYAIGLEVSSDYEGVIPEGFDVIDIPEATYLLVNSGAFDKDNYSDVIESVKDVVANYDKAEIDFTKPSFMIKPDSSRGYMEIVPLVEGTYEVFEG